MQMFLPCRLLLIMPAVRETTPALTSSQGSLVISLTRLLIMHPMPSTVIGSNSRTQGPLVTLMELQH